uniref:p23 protein n=1 Tax=Hibiscus chlorotic ringspot virus TaxID=53181 RepID=Q27K40_9TOMB|nr:p23 protein [Hibiscus chlorotic ringspot virus]
MSFHSLMKLFLSVRHCVSQPLQLLMKLLRTPVSLPATPALLKSCACVMSSRLMSPLMRTLRLVWKLFPLLQAIRKCSKLRGSTGVSLRSMLPSQLSSTLGVLQPQRALTSLQCGGGLRAIARKGGWLTHTLYKRSLWPLLWYLRQGPLKSLSERSLIVLCLECGGRLWPKLRSRAASNIKWCLRLIGRERGSGPGGSWWVSLIFRGTPP